MDIKGKRLRLLFSDLLTVERGKYLFGDVADEGRAAFCIGLYPLTTDKEILDISGLQFDIGLPDVEAFLDRDTLRLGWEEDTVVGIADVHRQGRILDVDPRQVLRKAVEPWRAMGLEPLFAFETELYLLEPDEKGGWRSVSLPSHRVDGTGMSVDPTGTIDDLVRAAMGSGFPIEAGAASTTRLRGEHPLQVRSSRRPTSASCSACWSRRSRPGTGSSPRSWAGRSTTAAAAACT